MEQKRCPACGTLLAENADKCTACKLEGLNLRFLSKAGYEKWVKEVLEPHKATIVSKVFAGSSHGLILTSRGELYGIGDNRYRQLADTSQYRYEQPVLIARDVVSAAAWGNCTAYVKQDGIVRWQYEKKLPAISDVRAIYGESWKERFWAVKSSGEVLCFGDNCDGVLAERRKQIVCQLPEVSGVKHGFGPPIQWLDNDSLSMDAEIRFRDSEEYRSAVRQYGEKNVELDVNEVEPNKALKALYFTFRKGLEAYRPVIYRVNNWYYDPVSFKRKWREDLPHRIYGRPILAEEYIRGGWESGSGSKKISLDTKPEMELLEDGSVMAGKTKLDWLQQPVGDIARGSYIILMACANGEILWCDGELFGEDEWKKMTDGQMNICRLPEDA